MTTQTPPPLSTIAPDPGPQTLDIRMLAASATTQSFREFFEARWRRPWPRLGEPNPPELQYQINEAVADYLDVLARVVQVNR